MRRHALLGSGTLLLALAACEPQAVSLFGDGPVVSDAGTGSPPAALDTGAPPAPPPALEQPDCLSAECERCVAEGCVVAGARWLCHPVTGECELPCEPVSDGSQCPRQETCHPGYGLCVDCVGSADCSGATAACDTQRNSCVECTSDATCAAPTPACDTGAQRCVECTAARHCGQGLVCDADAQRCVQCVVDDDCDGVGSGDDPLPRCDRARNVCVECLVDDDCTSDPDKPFCKQSELECDDDRD